MTIITLHATRTKVPASSGILSEEQIEQLLQEAEGRLREKAGLVIEPPLRTELALAPSEKQSTKHKPLPKLQHHLDRQSYIKDHSGIAKADPTLLLTNYKHLSTDELRSVPVENKSKKVNDQTTAGPQWFDIPKTEVTPALKRDLQLIEMRSVLDPHRHYKKNTRRGQIPTFSQVGTVIEGPTEWYSGRINKKDRSKTFVEEAMKTEAQSGRFKRKYNEIQNSKTGGKKAHYKKLMAKRGKSS